MLASSFSAPRPILHGIDVHPILERRLRREPLRQPCASPYARDVLPQAAMMRMPRPAGLVQPPGCPFAWVYYEVVARGKTPEHQRRIAAQKCVLRGYYW